MTRLTAQEAADRVARCLAEAGYPQIRVVPNTDRPHHPWVMRPPKVDEPMSRAVWRATFLMREGALSCCWECWWQGVLVRSQESPPCDHPVVWK